VNRAQIKLMGLFARELRTVGLARRLREAALRGSYSGFRGWMSVYDRLDRRQKDGMLRSIRMPLPRHLRDAPREEVEAWISRERAHNGMTPGRAEKKGWVQISRSAWVQPWNQEEAIRQAQAFHEAKWTRVALVMRNYLRDRQVWDLPPTLLWEHLVEQGMNRPANDFVNCLRCGLLEFFCDKRIQEEWVEREQFRNQEWWRSAHWKVFPERNWPSA